MTYGWLRHHRPAPAVATNRAAGRSRWRAATLTLLTAALLAISPPASAHVVNPGSFTLDVTGGTVSMGLLNLPLPTGSMTGDIDGQGNITIPLSTLQVTDEPFSYDNSGVALSGTATFDSGAITGTLDPGSGTASLSTKVFASVSFTASVFGVQLYSGTCSFGGSADADHIPVTATTDPPFGIPYSQQTGTATMSGRFNSPMVCAPDLTVEQILQVLTGTSSRVTISGVVSPILTDDSRLSLSPRPMSFGDVQVGASTTRTLTLSNPGTDPTYLSATPSLSGPNAGDFALVLPSLTCQQVQIGILVPAGGSCSVDVRFTPGGTGGRSATLTAPNFSADGPQTLDLSGTGIDPGLNATPTNLIFGPQVVGTTSAKKDVTVTNTGTTVLAVTGGVATGDFTADAGGCTGGSVAPGGSCVISVRFTPTALGIRSGTLSITSNAASSPDHVLLSGTGVAPLISVAPTTLKFGSVPVTTTSAPLSVTVSNGGTAPLTVTSATASGPFGVSTDDCSNSGPIAAGGTCLISVVFSPTTQGPATGTLSISSDGGTATVALSGTGATLADLSISIGASPNPAKRNGSLTYAITVKNAGPTAAASPIVTDTLPSNVQFQSLSVPSGSSCTTPAVGATGTVKCTIGTLNAAASAQLKIVVKVVAPKGTTINDTVKVTSSTTDPDPLDNQATVSTSVR